MKILKITVIIIIFISLLISILFLKNKKTTKTKAAEIASLSCIQNINNKRYIFFQRNGGNPVCNEEEIKKGNPANPIDAWLLMNNNRCQTNEQCGNGLWCYFFNGNQKNSYCLSRDPNCDNGSCWQSNSNIQQNKTNNINASNNISEINNGCFSLKAEFEVRNANDKKAFYSWITFQSEKGGDVKLEYNKSHVAGWNKFPGGVFSYSPQWTQPYVHDSEHAVATLSKGQTLSFDYTGMHSGCTPQSISLSCYIGYNNNGSVFVNGLGCSCKNCQNFESRQNDETENASEIQEVSSTQDTDQAYERKSIQGEDYARKPPQDKDVLITSKCYKHGICSQQITNTNNKPIWKKYIYYNNRLQNIQYYSDENCNERIDDLNKYCQKQPLCQERKCPYPNSNVIYYSYCSDSNIGHCEQNTEYYYSDNRCQQQISDLENYCNTIPKPNLTPPLGEINCYEFDCGEGNIGIKYYAKCTKSLNANQNCGSFNIYKDKISCQNETEVQLNSSSLNNTSIKTWCNNQDRKITFKLVIKSWNKNIDYDPSYPNLEVAFYYPSPTFINYVLICKGDQINLKQPLSGVISKCSQDVKNHFNKVKVELKYKKSPFQLKIPIINNTISINNPMYDVLTHEANIISLNKNQTITIEVDVK